jgi:DNA topoisomerase-1
LLNFWKYIRLQFHGKRVEQDFDKLPKEEMWMVWYMIERIMIGHQPLRTLKLMLKEAESVSLVLILEQVKPVSVRLEFGPMAQIGDAETKTKKFASLMNEQNIGTSTLEEALNLFLLPKNLGRIQRS